jgi:hypothetical protein
VFPALATLAMSSATEADSGLASGLLNTTAQVGGALGLAVLATVAASQNAALLAGGNSQAAALTGGFRVVFAISTGLLLAGVVLSALVLRPAAAQRVSDESEGDTTAEDAA